MSRRWRLPVLIALTVVVHQSAAAVAAQARDYLSVLQIIVAELRSSPGCYGAPIAKTPAIDRLASIGVRFDNGCVQRPICDLQQSVNGPTGPASQAGAVSTVQRRVKGNKGNGFCPVWMTLARDSGMPRRMAGRSVRSGNW